MGCDIHDWAEVRGPDGRWTKCGAVFKNPFHRPEDEQNEFWNSPVTDSPYEGRNYRLFAVLAGVRNDYGIVPIVEPRGVPHDVSPEVLKEYVLTVVPERMAENEEERVCTVQEAERWVASGSSVWVEQGRVVTNPDWHSASWLTLRELLEFDWTGGFRDSGWVTPQQYLEWKRRGRPSSWCKSVGGGGVRHVSNAEMDELIRTGEVTVSEDTMTNVCTQVEWGDAFVSSSSEFLGATVPALLDQIVPEGRRGEARQFLPGILGGDKRGLAPLSDWLQDHGLPSLDDVRMTFWFDN